MVFRCSYRPAIDKIEIAVVGPNSLVQILVDPNDIGALQTGPELACEIRDDLTLRHSSHHRPSAAMQCTEVIDVFEKTFSGYPDTRGKDSSSQASFREPTLVLVTVGQIRTCGGCSRKCDRLSHFIR
jgi:hypothetical protein